MFGLGPPFTVYSPESEGLLIESHKPHCDGPATTCFAFTTTGEVYIGAILEQCLKPPPILSEREEFHQMTLSLFVVI